MLEKYNDTLNVQEVCEVLNIGENKAYEMLKNKEIQNIRCGRKYIIPKICVCEFLMSAFEDKSVTDLHIQGIGYNNNLYSSRDSSVQGKELN